MTAIALFASHLKFIDAHASPDTLRDKLAPDIGVYLHDNLPRNGTKTDFSKMELFVEVKFADISDPFHDPEDPLHPQANNFRFEKDSDDARLVRGQLASYAAAHMGSQFRVHAFSVLMCGTFARLIRWDRDGATVTRRFNYDSQPQILTDFFWRYTHLDRRQRGYDTSVSQASSDDVQRIQHVEKRLRDNNPAHREFCKVMVPERSDPKIEKPFILSYPPIYTTRSPFGRATRAMLAFDMEGGTIVFLKDYWRPDVDGMQKEGEIYVLLESKGVPNIAPFGKGNDLRDYLTVTLTHTGTKRREVGLLVERNGASQTIQNVPGCSQSSSGFVRSLPGVRKCYSRRHGR
jgi:Fungal protein kinase